MLGPRVEMQDGASVFTLPRVRDRQRPVNPMPKGILGGFFMTLQQLFPPLVRESLKLVDLFR